MNNEMIDIIVKCVFAVCTVILQFYLLPMIKAKLGEYKWNEIMEFCRKCVQAAEKIYSPEQWEQKKKYVFEQMTTKINALGVSIDDSELNSIIEGFVKEVKG